MRYNTNTIPLLQRCINIVKDRGRGGVQSGRRVSWSRLVMKLNFNINDVLGSEAF